MQLPPLATPGCAGDERWSPGAAGFMKQYRRMALGGTAPGGTCSLGLWAVLEIPYDSGRGKNFSRHRSMWRSRWKGGDGCAEALLARRDGRQGSLVQEPLQHAFAAADPSPPPSSSSWRTCCSSRPRQQVGATRCHPRVGAPAARRAWIWIMERPPGTAAAGALVVRVQHQAGDLGMMTAGANVRSVYMVLPTNPTHGANDILPSMHWCMYSSIVAVTGELISRDVRSRAWSGGQDACDEGAVLSQMRRQGFPEFKS
jgi:hypothetical protein